MSSLLDLIGHVMMLLVFLSDESNHTHNLTGSVVEDTHEPSVPLHLGCWVSTIFLSRSFYENILLFLYACVCAQMFLAGAHLQPFFQSIKRDILDFSFIISYYCNIRTVFIINIKHQKLDEVKIVMRCLRWVFIKLDSI